MTGWHLDRDRLADALQRWSRVRKPGDQEYVNDFLMDLVEDPFACGLEDDDTGVWTGLAGSPGRRVVVVYIPDQASRTIAVADINYR